MHTEARSDELDDDDFPDASEQTEPDTELDTTQMGEQQPDDSLDPETADRKHDATGDSKESVLHNPGDQAEVLPSVKPFADNGAVSIEIIGNFEALERAVETAESGDSILLLTSILSEHPLTIDKDLSFLGLSEVEIYTSSSHPLFILSGTCTVSFENVSLRGGNLLVEQGGNIIIEGASVTGVLGGQAAIHINGADTVTLRDITLARNDAGGIWFSGGSLLVERGELFNNTANFGSALLLDRVEGNVKLEATQITGNTGTAIYLNDASIAEALYVDGDCTFSANNGEDSPLPDENTYYVELHNDRVSLPLHSFSRNSDGNLHKYAYNGRDIGWPGMPSEGTQTITVTFWGNGGTFQDFNAGMDDGSRSIHVSPGVLLGEILAENALIPHREGYQFVRWDADHEGLVNWGMDAPIFNDMNFYVIWDYAQGPPDPQSFTVIYFLDGQGAAFAAGYDPSGQYAHGSLLAQPVDPVWEGYTFLGWRDTDTGRDWLYDSDTVTRDINLTARWRENDAPPAACTVTYALEGGRFPEDATPRSTYVVGDLVERPSNPLLAGYDFTGWHMSDGTPWSFENGVLTGDLTLHAKWRRRSTGTGTPGTRRPGGGGNDSGILYTTIPDQPIPLAPGPAGGLIDIQDEIVPLAQDPNPSTGGGRRSGVAYTLLLASLVTLLRFRRNKQEEQSE